MSEQQKVHLPYCSISSQGVCSCHQFQPPQEMKSLADIKAGIMNILAAQDKLWQSLGAIERKLDRNWQYETNLEKTRFDVLGRVEKNIADLFSIVGKVEVELKAGFGGVSDGVGLAIGELRGQIMNLRPPAEYPIAKEVNGKVILFWPDRTVVVAPAPKQRKRSSKVSHTSRRKK